MTNETLPTNEHDYTEDFDLQFRPLLEVVAYDAYLLGPQ